MPHIEVTYSANLEDTLDIAGLCNTLREATIAADVAPVAGIRVRAFRCDHYSIADGAANHGYVDFSIRLREGRSDEVKTALSNRLFDAAKQFIEPEFKTHSIALSMELRDINPAFSPKTGSIRQFLGQS